MAAFLSDRTTPKQGLNESSNMAPAPDPYRSLHAGADATSDVETLVYTHGGQALHMAVYQAVTDIEQMTVDQNIWKMHWGWLLID